MALWFEILVLILLAAIVVQLYGIEGNITVAAQAIATEIARSARSDMERQLKSKHSSRCWFLWRSAE